MSKKTYKRETAGLSMVGVFITGGLAIFTESEMAMKVLEIITTPVITFATAMFGADFVRKQTEWGGPPEEEQ